MIYAIICKDKPGSLETRKETRPEHLAWLSELNAQGSLKFAGPFLDDDGNSLGSLVAIEAEDRAQAEAIAANDPYAIAGLFQTVEVHPWNWVLNNPEKA